MILGDVRERDCTPSFNNFGQKIKAYLKVSLSQVMTDKTKLMLRQIHIRIASVYIDGVKYTYTNVHVHYFISLK